MAVHGGIIGLLNNVLDVSVLLANPPSTGNDCHRIVILGDPHLTEITEKQVSWLRDQLEKNKNLPTLIFFHAPLLGTLLSYNKDVNTHNFIAQPKEEIAEIINHNPQILLWVSGHTHTPATNQSYASNINVVDGHVTNIHNADMDRERIWSNSLYLYPDKIIVKTFNHKEQVWEDGLERTIYVQGFLGA